MISTDEDQQIGVICTPALRAAFDFYLPKLPTVAVKGTEVVRLAQLEQLAQALRVARTTRNHQSPAVPTLRSLINSSSLAAATSMNVTVGVDANSSDNENLSCECGGKLVIPEKFLKTRRSRIDTKDISKGLLVRRKFLQAQYERREYNRMIRNIAPELVAPNLFPELTGAEGPGLKSSAVGINMLLAALSCFFVADYLCRQYGMSVTMRTGISTSALVIILIIEMLLFIIRAGKADEMDKKRRARLENAAFLQSTRSVG
jgi:hypothetical protein